VPPAPTPLGGFDHRPGSFLLAEVASSVRTELVGRHFRERRGSRDGTVWWGFDLL
jgi:hypothetical protein